MRRVSFSIWLAAGLSVVPAFSQQPKNPPNQKSPEEMMKDCPMHKAHAGEGNTAPPVHSHEAGAGAALEKRGNAGMGFEQSKTSHHFLLWPEGGVIQVQANEAKDLDRVAQIQMHLRHIAAAFADGDFQIPLLVHDAIPPGTTTMKRLREKIQYAYEETPTGARVVIKTNDPSALDAVHDFLRYQIREHETGDPETIR